MKSFFRGVCTILSIVCFSIPIVAFAAAPVLQNMSLSMNEDAAPRNITLTARTSNRSETLTYSIESQPRLGTASLSGNIATYTPTANAFGTDTFTYKACGSSTGCSTTATVTITINSRNDVPVAISGLTLTTNEDTAGTVQLGGTDADGDQLTCASNGANNGSFSVNSSTCVATFTPNAHFTGTTQASYRVHDGTAYSPTATVSITVNPSNLAPVVTDATLTVAEDTSGMLTLTGSDADNDPLSYTIINQPTNGVVTFFDTRTIIYTPTTSDFNGADTFTYQAYDGTTSSNTGTVLVTITAVNDTPVANDQTLTTTNTTDLTLTITASDVDSDALDFRLVTQPSAGWVTLDGDVITFSPDVDFLGSTNFTFSVSDGARSDTGTISLNILAAPIGHETSATTLKNTSITISAHATDLDSTTLSYSLYTEPTHGTAIETDAGVFAYTPSTDYFGQDTFTLTATDGTYDSAPFTIAVNVVPDSGIPGIPVAQAGINFVTFSRDNNLSPDRFYEILNDLGVQAMRQIGEADTTWAVVEFADDLESTDFGEPIRTAAYDHSISVAHTLFAYMLGSCTPPWMDYSDPAQFVRTVDDTCRDYLARAATTINSARSLHPEQVAWIEPGNELFHWMSYDDTHNYTPEEQADVLLTASEYMHSTVPNTLILVPSVMLNDGASPEWRDRVETHIGTEWYDIENIHDYSDWSDIERDTGVYLANSHIAGKLMAVTETCRSSEPDDTRTTDNTLEKQAAAIFQNYSLFWGARFFTVNWHALVHGTTDNELDGCGFINADGSYMLPAYTYRLLTQKLLPFNQITNLSDADRSTMLYEYGLSSGEIKYVAWGTDSWVVPEGMSQMTSVMPQADGSFNWQSVTPGDTVTLQDTPILVE